MKKRTFGVVSILLVIALLCVSITAFATENYAEADLERSFKKMSQIAEKSTEVIDVHRISAVKEFVKNSIDDNNVVLNFESAYLNYGEAKLLNITSGDDVYTSITIPVKGDNYSLISNVTFVLLDSRIVAYTESLITKGADNKFIIDTYYDGILIESNHTDIDYISDKEIQEGLDSIHENVQKGKNYAQTRGIGAIAGCLASVLGVNAVVAYLIAGTCIASCPAVVPICVACIAGVCTIGAADVAAVVACFSL